MIFSLEFGKIFKRKFNYLFGMIILLISFLLIYKTSGLAGYYDLDEVDFIFKFTFLSDRFLIKSGSSSAKIASVKNTI